MAEAISPVEAGEMGQRIWAWLAERDGVDPDDRSTWPVEVSKRNPSAKQASSWLPQCLHVRTDGCDPRCGWHQFGLSPQALLTFPTDAPWELPHTRWHFHLPARGPVSGFGALRRLGSANHVGPRGGGTLGAEGSPPSRPQDRR